MQITNQGSHKITRRLGLYSFKIRLAYVMPFICVSDWVTFYIEFYDLEEIK